MSCAGWQLSIWTVDKQSGASESVDRMCGEDNKREYTIPTMFTRLLHITVHSVHTSLQHYSLHWEATGDLLPDSQHFQVSLAALYTGENTEYQLLQCSSVIQ